jgi:hypothetical protein
LVLQAANKVDDRDTVRATVEVVAQKGQMGVTPAPCTGGIEQVRLPKRGDQIVAVPVDVTDYIVHLTNLRTLR